jgi:hypothetical protein
MFEVQPAMSEELMDAPQVLTDAPSACESAGSAGLPRLCMNCRRRPATRMSVDGKGRNQFRCDDCFAKKKMTGLGKKAK